MIKKVEFIIQDKKYDAEEFVANLNVMCSNTNGILQYIILDEDD